MSAYAVPVGNNGWSGGSDIRAVTEAEAREWLEDRALVDELEAHFGGMIEDA